MILRAPANRRAKHPFGALLALGLLLGLPVLSPGQGCPMCRETAAFQKGRAIDSLKRGIVALAIPPAGVALGLAWVTWKRSNRFSSD